MSARQEQAAELTRAGASILFGALASWGRHDGCHLTRVPRHGIIVDGMTVGSPVTILVRQAENAEATLLTSLALRSKASHGYDAAFMEKCRNELFIGSHSLSERDIWVAQDTAGTIVGFFGLWPPVGGVAEVDPVFVEPARTGQGVGQALWRKLEDRARFAGADKIGLDADPNAVGFYERMGCVTIGESPSASIPGRFLPRMEKRLL
ncbi:MAG: GNAT family N-acetyltransferase [Pseudomonadota bacterium]|nr:GNAT family N-acetyltransferase [Pseudomonadota bacterium]